MPNIPQEVFDPQATAPPPLVNQDPTVADPSVGSNFQEMAPSPDPTVPSAPGQAQLFHETREGRLLSSLIEELERPEINIREQMVGMWKKMENYWRDRQYIIWDDFSADWRTPDEISRMDASLDIDPAAYAKVVNIYKAHGQAIIAALSAGLPYVRFFPDDADAQDDIFTAKAYTKLSELIQKRNKGQLVFMRALYYLFNFGTVFAYNENKDTNNFGTIKKANYIDTPIINRYLFCPNCGFMHSSEQIDQPLAPPPAQSIAPPPVPSPNPTGLQTGPPKPGLPPGLGAAPAPPPPVPIKPPLGGVDVPGGMGPTPAEGPAPADPMSPEPPQMGMAPQMSDPGQSPSPMPPMGAIPPPTDAIPCPSCGAVMPPDAEDYEDNIPRLSGYTDEPKSHEYIEVFSGLHVKFPHWCANQGQSPYLSLETEEHIALLQEIYPEVGDRFTPSGDDVTNERMARRNSDYRGDTPQDLMTFKRSWMRPWAFNKLGMNNKDDIDFLKQKYPHGVYIAKVEDLIVEAVPDALDDHWTISVNPLSDSLHADPLAQSLVPVQDIINELSNLTLETIEFGIPETFYEVDAIDSDQYKKSEARPGMLYPAKSKPQMGLDSSFHTIKASALSQEVDNFADRMTQAGQFVSGAFPTIWGGALEGGGGTAKEYEQSRAMALQRLNLTWSQVKIWWADVMGKAVRSFAANMKDDERYVERKGSSFVNVWVRRAEMNGKVGSVEPDVSEAFPISWAQKRDILMNLISMKNPMIESVLTHPENSGTIAAIAGFPDLYIPGDDDRNKQLYEISQLIQAQPSPTGIPGPDGQEVMQPTVPINKWDNHQVEAEICKAWLKSEVGLDAKESNAGGYMNVVAHMKLHDYQVMQQQQAMMQQQASMGAAPGQPGKPGQPNQNPQGIDKNHPANGPRPPTPAQKFNQQAQVSRPNAS